MLLCSLLLEVFWVSGRMYVLVRPSMLMIFVVFWASGRMYVHARPSVLLLFFVFWANGCTYAHMRPSTLDAICGVFDMRRPFRPLVAGCLVSESRLCCYVQRF